MATSQPGKHTYQSVTPFNDPFIWWIDSSINNNVLFDYRLPSPKVPRFDFMSYIFIDSAIIGIVCYAVSLSLAKIFAKKHKYEVEPNQELIALGAANVFSSFFLAYPAAAALSRSTLQFKIGGKTQIAGLFSCIIILFVILFLGELLYHLPRVRTK